MPRIQLEPTDVQQLPVTYRATIPEEYLDAMGHMNVMWYTHLFSCAMGGMFQLVGLSWDDIHEHGGGTFALESHIRYLSEVLVGQTIEIHSRVLGRSVKRFHALHFMTNLQKQDVSATFEVVGAYVDIRRRRMAPLPDSVGIEFDRLIAEHNQLDWPAPVSGVMQP